MTVHGGITTRPPSRPALAARGGLAWERLPGRPGDAGPRWDDDLLDVMNRAEAGQVDATHPVAVIVHLGGKHDDAGGDGRVWRGRLLTAFRQNPRVRTNLVSGRHSWQLTVEAGALRELHRNGIEHVRTDPERYEPPDAGGSLVAGTPGAQGGPTGGGPARAGFGGLGTGALVVGGLTLAGLAAVFYIRSTDDEVTT
jgi:hypothetical protein